MAKLTLEELQEKVKTILGENSTSDDGISLLEDITDSYSAPSIDWEAKYKENDASWRQKYRDRFFSDVKQVEPEYEMAQESAPMKTKFEELFN